MDDSDATRTAGFAPRVLFRRAGSGLLRRWTVGLVLALSLAPSRGAGSEAAQAGTELHEAVRAGDWAQVRSLLEIDPTRVNDQPDRYDRCTPLHFAVRRRHTDLVLLLVEHGADVNRVDKYGLSPMDLAVGYGLDAIREFLRFHGARALHSEEAAVRAASLRATSGSRPFTPGTPLPSLSLLPGSGRVFHALSDGPGVQLVVDPAEAFELTAFGPGARNLRAGRGGFLLRGGDAAVTNAPSAAPPAQNMEVTDGSQAVVRGTPVVLIQDGSIDRTIDEVPAEAGGPVAFEFTNEDQREHRLAFSVVDETSRLVLECDRPVTLPPPIAGFPTVHIREGTTISIAEETASGRFYVLLPPGGKLRVLIDPSSVRPVLPPAMTAGEERARAPDNAALPAATRTFVPTPYPFGGPPLLIQAPSTEETPSTPPASAASPGRK